MPLQEWKEGKRIRLLKKKIWNHLYLHLSGYGFKVFSLIADFGYFYRALTSLVSHLPSPPWRYDPKWPTLPFLCSWFSVILTDCLFGGSSPLQEALLKESSRDDSRPWQAGCPWATLLPEKHTSGSHAWWDYSVVPNLRFCIVARALYISQARVRPQSTISSLQRTRTSSASSLLEAPHVYPWSPWGPSNEAWGEGKAQRMKIL